MLGLGVKNDSFPFGMLVPNRNYSSPEYRYGYQGSEKDDEVKGSGNSYTTHFRQLEPRIAKWLSRDPKVTAFETPYSSMSNNPILYNDIKGDTISFRGSGVDTDKVINTYSKQLGNNNISYNEIFDDNGNLTGVDIYEACENIANNGNDELNNELINVINSSHNTRIFKVTTRRRFETDFPKNRGGALASRDSKKIKKYLGNNYFEYVIFMADDFFDHNYSTGDYDYIEYQAPFMMDNTRLHRNIPFNEAVFHETIHISLWQSGRKNTENTVISIMNKYRVLNKILKFRTQ